MSDLSTVHGCGIAVLAAFAALYGAVYLIEVIHRGEFFF